MTDVLIWVAFGASAALGWPTRDKRLPARWRKARENAASRLLMFTAAGLVMLGAGPDGWIAVPLLVGYWWSSALRLRFIGRVLRSREDLRRKVAANPNIWINRGEYDLLNI